MIKKFPSLILLKLLVGNRASLNFLMAVASSMAFSMFVILATSGVMGGFEEGLKLTLRGSSSDATLQSSQGFFAFDQDLRSLFKSHSFHKMAPLIQTEGFFVYDGTSKAALIRGVDSSFAKVTELAKLHPKPGEVFLGKELALELGVEKGDQLSLTMGGGNKTMGNLPRLESFTYQGQVDHGFYEINSRLAYVNRDYLAELLKVKGQVNQVIFDLSDLLQGQKNEQSYTQSLSETLRNFPAVLEDHFFLKPFWSEFSHLLEAIETEKLILLLVLQAIVLVSIFNLISFTVYLKEKKAKEIFLFQALGATPGQMTRTWMVLLFVIWPLSCALGLLLTEIFDSLLKHSDLFALPPEIYGISRLRLRIPKVDLFITFISALIWPLLLFVFSSIKQRKKTVISHLRKEFHR